MRLLYAWYASLLEDAARPQSTPDYGRMEKAFSGNLCRGTGYDKIFKAVMSVADGEVLDDPETASGYRTTCRLAAVSTNKSCPVILHVCCGERPGGEDDRCENFLIP